MVEAEVARARVSKLRRRAADRRVAAADKLADYVQRVAQRDEVRDAGLVEAEIAVLAADVHAAAIAESVYLMALSQHLVADGDLGDVAVEEWREEIVTSMAPVRTCLAGDLVREAMTLSDEQWRDALDTYASSGVVV